MSKKRVITSKMRASQKFASLTLRQRDLWHGLIVSVDDQGRMPGEPAYIRSQVWAYDDFKVDEVASDLARLVDSESIVIYLVDDIAYIQIVNWWKYQNMQWAGASDYPPPDNWVDRERFHGAGNKIFTKNWESKGGFTQLPESLPSELPSELPSNKGTPREKEVVKGRKEEKKKRKGENKNASTSDSFYPRIAPDKILCDASGLSYFPSDYSEYVDVVIRLAEDYGVEEATEAMKEACNAWTLRKNKNGRNYPATKLVWIDWAQDLLLGGELPSQGKKKLTTEEEIEKFKREKME